MIEDGMSNADWDQLRADGGGDEGEKRAPEPEPEPSLREREAALPGALVPPPFEEEEPPFTD